MSKPSGLSMLATNFKSLCRSPPCAVTKASAATRSEAVCTFGRTRPSREDALNCWGALITSEREQRVRREESEEVTDDGFEVVEACPAGVDAHELARLQ